MTGAEPVLVLRALGLGDALTAVPALRGLRRLHPDRPLLLAAAGPPARLLQDCGVVDAVVPTSGLDAAPPGAGLGPHLAVNLHGRGPASHRLLQAGRPDGLLAYACAAAGVRGPAWRGTEHEVRRWCRLVDAAADDAGGAGGGTGGGVGGGTGSGAPSRTRRVTRPDDLRLQLPASWAVPEALRAAAGAGPYVVLHPGASGGARRWPPRRWARVARELERTGVPVLLTGGPGERALVRGVTTAAGLPSGRCTAGELTLPELAVLVAGAALLLCGDTGVAHLATALGTPSVILFGPVPPARWGPLADPDRHTVIWHGAGLGEGDGNADRCDPALLRVRVDEVISAATARLDRVTAGTAGS